MSEYLHPDTSFMMTMFTDAVKAKLMDAQTRYGYTNNWMTDNWEEECRRQLYIHAEKGDPLDVAIYAAFMWARGWSTKREDKG